MPLHSPSDTDSSGPARLSQPAVPSSAPGLTSRLAERADAAVVKGTGVDHSLQTSERSRWRTRQQ